MNEIKTVFRVRVWFDDYYDDYQVRFVVAKDEEEAEKKIQAYARKLKRDGFAQLNYLPGFTVEVDYVID